ncbi:helix-turn-helix domain-containing protein [Streptomyces coerulescens]|uniref:Helix-turn-helix domain-containing protein n=1 Tax=Streptomyces coerulescens TaxID=29304 RepID=A0ABW0CMZ9_STRCD
MRPALGDATDIGQRLAHPGQQEPGLRMSVTHTVDCDRLRHQRETTGLTQQSLADRAIMTRSRIVHIESKQGAPSRRTRGGWQGPERAVMIRAFGLTY